MNIHRWRVAQEALDFSQIEIFFPPGKRRTRKNDLRNAVLANKRRYGFGYVLALKPDHFGVEVFSEANIGRQIPLVFRSIAIGQLNVDHKKLGINRVGQASATRNELLRCRTGTDAYGYPLTHTPILVNALGFQIRVQPPASGLRYLTEREFAQRQEIAFSKKIPQRALHPLHWINVSAAHSGLQGFGWEVGHYNFVSALDHPVRHSFPNLNSSHALNGRSDTLQVLDI